MEPTFNFLGGYSLFQHKTLIFFATIFLLEMVYVIDFALYGLIYSDIAA